MLDVTFFRFSMFILLGVFMSGVVVSVSLALLIYFGNPYAPGISRSIFKTGAFLIGFSFLLSVPFWIWGSLAGFLPFRLLRKAVWTRSENETFANASAGFSAAAISSVPLLYLIGEEIRKAEPSGLAFTSSFAVMIAFLLGPLLAVSVFKSDTSTEEVN